MKPRASLVGLGCWLVLALPDARAQTPAGQPGTGLQAGGLTPPGSGQNATAPPAPGTEQELARAEQEDSGRGLKWFWLDGEVGVEHLGLQTLNAGHLVDPSVTKTTQTGLVVGGGAGVRLFFLTVGPRFRFGNFAAWRLWTLDGEVGFRIPLGVLEPYVTLSGGYASVGSFDPGNAISRSAVGINGWNLRAGGGLDWFVSSVFSVGGNLTGEMLFLSRSKVSAANLGVNQQSVYAADGSSIGAGVTLTAVAGLHF
jgi:hypothetical protein